MPTGTEADFPTHVWPIRVYYEDTDLAGIVYYANYLRFIERGRTEALREMGIDQQRLQSERGLVFVVRRVEIDYLQPARFNDLLDIRTQITRLGGASLSLNQNVWRGDACLARAVVQVVLVDAKARSSRIPPDIRTAFLQIANA